jgi:hypothetical protein
MHEGVHKLATAAQLNEDLLAQVKKHPVQSVENALLSGCNDSDVCLATSGRDCCSSQCGTVSGFAKLDSKKALLTQDVKCKTLCSL